MIEVFLPSQQKISVDGSSGFDLLHSLSQQPKQKVVALKVNGEVRDLHMPLASGDNVELIDITAPEAEDIMRHSASHVMAQAVQELFLGAKVTIGPSIENGFYYDFDYERSFTPEDLEKIESRMREIIASNLPFKREEISASEAIELFKQKGETYKVEIIQDLKTDVVSLYRHGDWVDLCRGPHLPSTGLIGAIKLTSVAGAYWRGDERNPMLWRIYGTAFSSQKALDEYLLRLEEARKRDHRKLGKALDLFSIHDEVGPGFVIFHPKGALLRTVLQEWEIHEHLKRGYQIVMGPTLLREEIWKRSGHYDNYRENMYFTEVDNQRYGIKPMNCLAHMLIFKSQTRSYRDMPQRYFELGLVHRHEKSGVLHGLFRVRAFTQDDAHILCTVEQLNSEIQGVVKFVQDAMAIFGFDYHIEISTRPKKSIGSDEMWEMATNALRNSLIEMGIPFEVNEGEGAFYGPKIDVKLNDCLGREWQCATVQCDFTLPDRFELEYIGPDGKEHRPVMIHRVILGAVERFMGILIEQFAGAFPTWVAPIQAVMMTVTDASIPYAKIVADKLKDQGIRVQEDYRNEKINYKIREWQVQKVPYMLVVGKKEVETSTVSPRTRKGEDLKAMPIAEFLARIKAEIDSKRYDT